MQNHLLIRGPPRSGKTTLVKRILHEYQHDFQGFYTQEVRENNLRIGFDIIDIETNSRFPLARIGYNKPTGGKYEVYIEDFDKYLDTCKFDKSWVIIDEIGKMETFSQKFIKLLFQVVKEKSLIATIPSYHLPVVNKILQMGFNTIFDLNIQNREKIYQDIQSWLDQYLLT